MAVGRATLAAVMTTVVAGGGIPAPAAVAPPLNACSLVGAADVKAAFVTAVADPGTLLDGDATSSACLVRIRTPADDVTLLVTEATAGDTALQQTCAASGAERLAGVGDAACWNATQISIATTSHGIFYSVGVLKPAIPEDYAAALQRLLTAMLKRA